MRVVVDFDLCDSNGLCAQVSPEVFRLLDDDSLLVLQQRPAPALVPAAEAAARACPKLAISLLEQG